MSSEADDLHFLAFAVQSLLREAEHWSAYYAKFVPKSPHGPEWQSVAERRKRLLDRVLELDVS